MTFLVRVVSKDLFGRGESTESSCDTVVESHKLLGNGIPFTTSFILEKIKHNWRV